MGNSSSPITGTDRYGIYDESSDQQYEIGDRKCFEDGREFVYCKNAAVALTPGKLIQTAAEVANHANITVAASVAAGASNKVTLDIGATAITAGQYENGFLIINDATGEGVSYKIKSHPTSDGSEEVTFTLYDKVAAALTVDVSQATLVPSRGMSVIIAPTTKTGSIVGVPLIAVTASYYFWAQSRGPANVLGEGTVGAGDLVFASNTTAGAVEGYNATDILEPIVGTARFAITTTEYGIVDLCIN